MVDVGGVRLGVRVREPRVSNRLPSLTPGTVVAGRFRIEKKIGEGGFGAVYLATDLLTAETVVVKRLHAVAAADVALVRREIPASRNTYWAPGSLRS